MTTSHRIYSEAVADEALIRDLVLVEDYAGGGVSITVHPAEYLEFMSGQAWQDEPGGPWKAVQSFGSLAPGPFATADEAILFAMDGGPITKRLNYLLSYGKWGR